MSLIAWVLYKACEIYTLIIFIYILMTWFPLGNGFLRDVFDALGKICNPFLDIFRRWIPPIGGTVDISPVIAVLVLQLVVRLIVSILA